MPPKLDYDERLEALHAFVVENVALLASRSGDSVQSCLRERHSKMEKYLHTLLRRNSEFFNDAQQQRLADIYKLISSHRLAESIDTMCRLCKCPGDAACRSKSHVGARCTSKAQTAAIYRGKCCAC